MVSQPPLQAGGAGGGGAAASRTCPKRCTPLRPAPVRVLYAPRGCACSERRDGGRGSLRLQPGPRMAPCPFTHISPGLTEHAWIVAGACTDATGAAPPRSARANLWYWPDPSCCCRRCAGQPAATHSLPPPHLLACCRGVFQMQLLQTSTADAAAEQPAEATG